MTAELEAHKTELKRIYNNLKHYRPDLDHRVPPQSTLGRDTYQSAAENYNYARQAIYDAAAYDRLGDELAVNKELEEARTHLNDAAEATAALLIIEPPETTDYLPPIAGINSNEPIRRII